MNKPTNVITLHKENSRLKYLNNQLEKELKIESYRNRKMEEDYKKQIERIAESKGRLLAGFRVKKDDVQRELTHLSHCLEVASEIIPAEIEVYKEIVEEKFNEAK